VFTRPSPVVHATAARRFLSRQHAAENGGYAALVRDQYHEELEGITDSLVDITRMAGTAINRATTALLEADLQAAEAVISGDAVIDELYADIEQRAMDLLARQQPVASDLRILITSLRMVADVERMGDMAQHIAKVARRRYPASAIPPELHVTVLEMGQVAQRICAKCSSVIAGRDLGVAAELERDDDVMDDLHRRLFSVLLDPQWKGGIEGAIDVTLCGRYYERFCDHAVSVARRVVYLVTGERAQVAAE
jgi:phosphate transport system protein